MATSITHRILVHIRVHAEDLGGKAAVEGGPNVQHMYVGWRASMHGVVPCQLASHTQKESWQHPFYSLWFPPLCPLSSPLWPVIHRTEIAEAGV